MDKKLVVKNNENEIIDIEDIYKNIKEKIITARAKMLKHIDTTMIKCIGMLVK